MATAQQTPSTLTIFIHQSTTATAAAAKPAKTFPAVVRPFLRSACRLGNKTKCENISPFLCMLQTKKETNKQNPTRKTTETCTVTWHVSCWWTPVLKNLSLLQKTSRKKHTIIDVKLFPGGLCRNALIRSFRRQFLSQWISQPPSDAAGGSTSTMVEKWAWKWSTRYLQAQVPLKPIACASFCFFWANGGGGGGFFRDFFYTFPSLPSGFIMFHLSIPSCFVSIDQIFIIYRHW